jgi:hypothetical protein
LNALNVGGLGGVGLSGFVEERQGQSPIPLNQLQRHVIDRGSGPVLGGKGELTSTATHVEIGVAPTVEFTGAAQSLSRTGGTGVFAGMMNQQHSQVEPSLKFPQEGKQARDLGGVVFISCDQLSYVTTSSFC